MYSRSCHVSKQCCTVSEKQWHVRGDSEYIKQMVGHCIRHPEQLVSDLVYLCLVEHIKVDRENAICLYVTEGSWDLGQTPKRNCEP